MLKRLIPIILLAWMAVGTAWGTTFLTLQSTYLGDGWFQYRMNVMDDPFFLQADIVSVQFTTFTNLIDRVDGTNGWSYTATNGWEFTNSIPERPYSETFLMRSPETSFRLATNADGAVSVFSLVLSDFNPSSAASGNLVGYAYMNCLVPCSPAEADGSPTNYLFVLKLLPDVVLNRLIETNGNVYGIDFNWSHDATYVLQGSSDFNSWTNITYLWGYAPETVWTTNTPLNDFGQYFRVELVAGTQTTNLPPLSSALSTPNSSGGVSTGLPVTSCQLVAGKMAVQIATSSGQTVQVQALDSHNAVLQTQTITAQGTSVTATFDPTALPSPVYFRAAAVK
ncbi:MAG TPA: hypothetical protein VFV81_06425 [Verrucomicrobiae bacterium]|nr:hypothetical protein [Verrucomicrobiae bacterium]